MKLPKLSKNSQIVMGAVGLYLTYLSLSGDKKKDGDGGTGGSLNIPWIGPGESGDMQQQQQPVSQPVAFQISDKIMAAMLGSDQRTLTRDNGGLVATSATNSPYAQTTEKKAISSAGFSIEGLMASFDPSSKKVTTFATETAAVEKAMIQKAGFSTKGLLSSFDPDSGKITTFETTKKGSSGTVNYADNKSTSALAVGTAAYSQKFHSSASTTKKASSSSSSSKSVGAASSTNTGGFGMKQVGTTSSGGRVFK